MNRLSTIRTVRFLDVTCNLKISSAFAEDNGLEVCNGRLQRAKDIQGVALIYLETLTGVFF